MEARWAALGSAVTYELTDKEGMAVEVRSITPSYRPRRFKISAASAASATG